MIFWMRFVAYSSDTAPVEAFQAEFQGRRATITLRIFCCFATVELSLEGLNRDKNLPNNETTLPPTLLLDPLPLHLRQRPG